MATPISVRLDEDVRETLEREAKARQQGLSTYLRELATETARRVRHERIRAQSAKVGEYVQRSPEAQAVYASLGTPQVTLEPED